MVQTNNTVHNLTSKSCFNFFNSSLLGSVVKAASTYDRSKGTPFTLKILTKDFTKAK